MRIYWIILIGILGCLKIEAQQPCAWQLTTADGLPSLEVYDLYQDSKGYMWIGTGKGLCKYNGVEFFYYKNKAQKRASISGMQEDSKGRIWCRNFDNQIFYVEEDSLHYFDGIEVGSIHEFLITKNDELYILDGVKDAIFFFSKEKDNWKKQVFYWNVEGRVNISHVYHIQEGENNNLDLLTKDGLYKLVDSTFLFITKDGLTHGQMSTNNYGVISGNMLKSGAGLYVMQYHLNELNLHRFNKGEYSPITQFDNLDYLNESKNCLYMRSLSDSSYWVLTANMGAVEVFSSSPRKRRKGLILFPKDGISDLLMDHEGNYWASSLKNGVYIIPQLALMQKRRQEFGISEGGLGVMGKVENDLSLATDQQKVLLLDTEKQNIIHQYNIPNRRCNFILWDSTQKELCIGGGAYQFFFDKESTIRKRYNFTSSDIKNTIFYKDSVIINSRGTLGFTIKTFLNSSIIGAYPVYRSFFPYIETISSFIKEGKFTNTYRYKKHIRCDWVLNDEKNNRFLAVSSDTLMCYPEKSVGYPILNKEGQSIAAIYMEKSTAGILWICTKATGIYGLDENFQEMYHFTQKDGLLNNKMNQLRVSNEGLWLLANNGLQFFNPETKESRIYTQQDGLPTHEIRDIELLDGKVWLSTAESLISFDEQMASTNKAAPFIYIKSIAIHERDTTLYTHYDLEYTQNNLVIYVEGLAYRSRGVFQYKYRMLGIDSVWRYQASKTDFFRYMQLQAGNYKFEVKTVNEDGVESENTAKITFVIHPAYWQTWWFQGLGYLIIIGIIVGIVLLRAKTKRKEEQQKNLVNVLRMEALQSQMNPHFIFNVLTAVQNLWLQHKNELAMDLQSNFAKLLRKIFQYSSKKAIPIEQVEDFLNNYLRLEQIRFEHQVAITFEIEEELLADDYSIPPLLIQPIIENSFKHGLFHKNADRQLAIIFKKEGPYLYACVEDNGVGRKPKSKDAPQRSSGLSTTKERLAILQNSIIEKKHPYNNIKITDLTTKDGQAKGTKVELWIPFVIN